VTDLLTRARRVIALGASTLSKRSRAYVEGSSPAVFTCASDSLFGVDGRAYLDWSQGLGVNILGAVPVDVTKAVCAALWRGNMASVPSALEAKAAEALIAQSPYAGRPAMVRWLNSGTEACLAVQRIARRATGAHWIVSSGYHGWAESFMCLQPVTDGIPPQYREMTAGFAWGDLASLERALSECDAERVAAVIMEPAIFDLPPAGYLEAVRDMTHATGALLVFDETVTGFRVPAGLATSGVVPDMTIYGKALGAGVQPVACVVGEADVMAYSDCISGTYCGNAGAMAAVIAAVRAYSEADVPTHIWEIGLMLQWGMNETAHARDVPIRCEGMPARMKLTWPDPERVLWAQSVVVEHLADAGIHLHPDAILPSYAHTKEDVNRTVEAFAGACKALKAGAKLRGLERQVAFQRDPAKEAA
jgi:glutamate-1-semialdehyde 2,1-aminomutase